MLSPPPSTSCSYGRLTMQQMRPRLEKEERTRAPPVLGTEKLKKTKKKPFYTSSFLVVPLEMIIVLKVCCRHGAVYVWKFKSF